ncbi:hypothetical protein BurJ1DRAFT_2550 [Burkholderiales bacterium JOSHI_001]|nr:hypothetical protein BurJ1DRAFT_2550 [Burkholderiales bacterium JOSHI_001]
MLNIAVTPERVLIATDSMVGPAAYRKKAGAIVERSKLVALAGGVVLAGRGTLSHMHRVYQMLLRSPTDFDDAVTQLPSVLYLTGRHLESNARAVGLSAPAGQEIAVAGWSRWRKRMAAVVFEQVSRRDGYRQLNFGSEPTEGRVGHNVWHAEPGGIPFPRTLDDMVTLSLHQHRTVTERFPSSPEIGGRLLVAEVTRHGVTLQERADLGIPTN